MLIPLPLLKLKKPVHSVALLGDTGSVTDSENDPIMVLMRKWMEHTERMARLLFLGDNIYPKGLPPPTGIKR